ncbi:unnamed protein product [Heligmosomoides polygyrus]|uniref:HTH_Tnp_Tc3_1 domain-containing protein n=1 Tax=Heligmosomoides polygyrus TaxID=6339 RepID=A0A183FFI0_HELPZ|nr:unnamed protein product [Heligmosomoides polygyrus]
MASLEDRSAAVALLKLGSSFSTISKMLKLHRMQVHRVIKCLEETGGSENCPTRRPRQPARTPAIRKAVKDKLPRNPAESPGKHPAKEHKHKAKSS